MQVKLGTQIMLARQAEKQDTARQLKESGEKLADDSGLRMQTKPLFRRLRYALSRRETGRQFK